MKAKPVRTFLLSFALVAAASGVHAQPAAPDLQQLRALMGQTGLSSSQLELLRAEAAKLQACVAKLDDKAIARLQADAQQMAAEVEAMCKDGLREDAQQLALTHARTLANSPALKAVQACSSTLPALLDALPLLAATQVKGTNVCDFNLQPPPP